MTTVLQTNIQGESKLRHFVFRALYILPKVKKNCKKILGPFLTKT